MLNRDGVVLADPMLSSGQDLGEGVPIVGEKTTSGQVLGVEPHTLHLMVCPFQQRGYSLTITYL